jgi:hypothetical protein
VLTYYGDLLFCAIRSKTQGSRAIWKCGQLAPWSRQQLSLPPLLVSDDGRSPLAKRDGWLPILMNRSEHCIGYHYAQRETEQANCGQRNADETHGSSSELVRYPVRKRTDYWRSGSECGAGLWISCSLARPPNYAALMRRTILSVGDGMTSQDVWPTSHALLRALGLACPIGDNVMRLVFLSMFVGLLARLAFAFGLLGASGAIVIVAGQFFSWLEFNSWPEITVFNGVTAFGWSVPATWFGEEPISMALSLPLSVIVLAFGFALRGIFTGLAALCRPKAEQTT